LLLVRHVRKQTNMSSRKIIAICGLKRCGKDTLADFIQSKYGFQNIKIADPLKDMCAQLFGLSHAQIEGDVKEVVDPRWGVAPRQILQFVGTEMFQFKLQELMPQIGRSFWMRQLLDKHKHGCFVVSDMRFVHEYEILKAAQPDLIVIKIVRDGLKINVYNEHSSEKEWEHIPESFTVYNNGSIEQMFRDFESKYMLD
jgi:hypothetical protein